MNRVKGNSVLFGAQVEAKYTEQQVPVYKGNPLIEAQPPIKTIEDVVHQFAQFPQYDPEQKDWSKPIRMHCIYQLKDFIQPLPLHVDMETRFSVMIRQGYTARNPLLPSFKKQFSVGVDNLLKSGCNDNGYNLIGNRSTASGFCIIGPSGIGKSTSVEKILLSYPQVILHHKRSGVGLLKQLNWLKLECPSDGSLKSLCVDFFKTIDTILNENYSETHVNDRKTAETLQTPMAQIASLHCLGVLVIDEIQNLNLAKSGGEERALNFFTKLVNVLGIPVVLIGTGRSMFLFESVFAQARRATGMGDMILDRLEEGEDWDLIMDSIWDYQWTKIYAKKTKELTSTLYYESQGILDIAIKLFMHAQWKAISTNKEEITVEMIKKAADENLKLIKPYIIALRNGDRDKLMKMKDLKPEWLTLNDYINTSKEKVNIYGRAATEHRFAQEKRNKTEIILELVNLGEILGLEHIYSEQLAETILNENENDDLNNLKKIFAEHILSNNQKIEKGTKASLKYPKKKSVKKSWNINNKKDVLTIVNEGLKKNISAAESLRIEGLTSGFDEFI